MISSVDDEQLPDDQLDENAAIVIPQGGYGALFSVPVDGGDRFGVTSVCFDQTEELLWMGNGGGHVTSYYGIGLEKYTSFQVHASNEVRQVLTWDAGVLSLTENYLKCNTRQGLGVFSHTSSNFAHMQCMLISSPNTLLVGGHQQILVQLDLAKMIELRLMPFNEHDCAILRQNDQFIFSGDTQGKIALRAPHTLEPIHLLEAHGGTLSDFDICGNKLVTCGFSNRLGQFQCDRFLMVYDLRTFRTLPPVPLSIDPMFLRFLPVFSYQRLLVASQSGQFDVIEIGSSSLFGCQVDTGGEPVLCLDVSSTKQAVAFGDGGGFLHLFGDREQPAFNESSRQTEFADPVTSLLPIAFQDELTPYSLIPLPNATGPLLSDWPPHLSRRVYRKPLPLEPEILKTMRVVQFIGYVPNPGNRRRNQVPYDLQSPTIRNRGFRQHRYRYGHMDVREESFVPRHYRKTTFDEESNDLAQCKNRTPYSGLEYCSPNAYVNALMLVFYHISPLRKTMLSHRCKREHCLACELCSLFETLEKSAGKQPCSTSNFIRAFRSIPEVTALGLVLNDREDNTINLVRLFQNLNHFVLKNLSNELREGSFVEVKREVKFELLGSSPESTSEFDQVCKKGKEGKIEAANLGDSARVESEMGTTVIEQLFGFEVFKTFTCGCGEEKARNEVLLVLPLRFPLGDELKSPANFVALLEGSLCYDEISPVTPVWCELCEKFVSSGNQSRHTRSLPNILAISCGVETDRERKLFAVQQQSLNEKNFRLCRYGTECTRVDCRYVHDSGETNKTRGLSESWLPFRMEVILGSSDMQSPPVTVKHLNDDEGLDFDVSAKGKVYELRAVVCSIQERDQTHLVTLLKPDFAARSRLDQTKESREGLESESQSEPETPESSLENQEHPLPDTRGARSEDWVLFNDAAVSFVDRIEVGHFPVEWKTPCMIYYVVSDLEQHSSLPDPDTI